MKAKRNYRDSLFRSYFNNKKYLLELTNLLEGTNYTNPRDIRLTTLKGTFFNDLKNDISFQIGNRFIVLFEHQSTLNENMPLRCLFYVTKLLQRLTDQRAIYKEALLTIPTPRFYVFYNGGKAAPEHQELQLSDAFADKTKHSLELTVDLYNINYDEQKALLQKCRAMREYSQFVDRVQVNSQHGMTQAQAISEAIGYCLQHDLMKEFLAEKSKEVYDMVNFKWDAEVAKEVWKEEAMEKGRAEGKAEGKAEGMEKGKEKGKEETAMEMLRNKLDMQLIARCTKLSIKRIAELSKML